MVSQQTQGLIPNAESGLIAFIIAGTGQGTWAKIASNTPTRWYISGSWPVTPDSTTRIVILDSAVNTQGLSNLISNPNPQLTASYRVNVSNYGRQALFVRVSTQSGDETLSLPVLDPFREIFLFGSQGTRILTASATMQKTDYLVEFVNITSNVTYTCLPFDLIPNQEFIVVRQNCGSFTVTIQAVGQDTFTSGGNQIVLTDDTVNYQSNFKVPES